MFKRGEKVVFIGGFVIDQETIQPKKNEIVIVDGFSSVHLGNLYIKGYRFAKDNAPQSFRIENFRKLDYEFAPNLLAEISEAMKREEILN